MSWRKKEDLGTTLVASIHDLLRIPDDYLLERQRGFTWWAGDYAQSVWSDLGLFHNGVTLYRLHVETEMLRGAGHAGDCEQQLTPLMGDATLSGITYDRVTDLYKLHCSIYAQNENAEWIKRILLAATALQVVDAKRNPELSKLTCLTPAISAHPRGLREHPDALLDSDKQFFIPAGVQPSKWLNSEEWQTARDHVKRIAQHSVTDGGTYLDGEFDWHGSGSELPIRLEIRADRPHPHLGNGLDMTLTLPMTLPPNQRAHAALELNARERKEWNWCHDLGSWCCRGPDVAFRCFVPNVSYAVGILPALAHDVALRAKWVNEEISAHPIEY